eukprot:1194817-Prorocentrum_minimum.AAC.3
MLLVYTLVHPSATRVSHALKVMYTVMLSMSLFMGLNIQSETIDGDNALVVAMLVGCNALCLGVPLCYAALLFLRLLVTAVGPTLQAWYLFTRWYKHVIIVSQSCVPGRSAALALAMLLTGDIGNMPMSRPPCSQQRAPMAKGLMSFIHSFVHSFTLLWLRQALSRIAGVVALSIHVVALSIHMVALSIPCCLVFQVTRRKRSLAHQRALTRTNSPLIPMRPPPMMVPR